MKLRLFLLCCGVAVAGNIAGIPFIGKWKTNLAKSDFGQTTVTIASLPGGEWQATQFGVSYKFKMDGKDYPDNLGGAVAWKALSANTWEMVAKANDKVTETDSFQLAGDGKTLTDAVKAMKPDGGAMESATTYQRVSGGPGLAGKWKTQKVSGAADTIEMAPSGTNQMPTGTGLVFKDPDMGLACDAKLDGKDYPCTGPMLPPGFTVAMQLSASSGPLDITVKKDGKPYFKASYQVSPDGKTMTETGAATTGEDKFKIVFDRL